MPIAPLMMNELSASAKLLYVALCAHANADGVCYPSRRKLAELTSLSARTITTAAAELEAAGIIAAERRAATTTVYKLLPAGDIENISTPAGDIENISTPAGDIENISTPAGGAEIEKLLNSLPGAAVGRVEDVKTYINRHGVDEAERVIKRAAASRFLRGENRQKKPLPLSWILRHAEPIMRGKYDDWTTTARAVADYIQKGE